MDFPAPFSPSRRGSRRPSTVIDDIVERLHARKGLRRCGLRRAGSRPQPSAAAALPRSSRTSLPKGTHLNSLKTPPGGGLARSPSCLRLRDSAARRPAPSRPSPSCAASAMPTRLPASTMAPLITSISVSASGLDVLQHRGLAADGLFQKAGDGRSSVRHSRARCLARWRRRPPRAGSPPSSRFAGSKRDQLVREEAQQARRSASVQALSASFFQTSSRICSDTVTSKRSAAEGLGDRLGGAGSACRRARRYRSCRRRDA